MYLKKKEKIYLVYLKSEPTLPLVDSNLRERLRCKKKRALRPVQAERKVPLLIWEAVIYKTMQIGSSLFQMLNDF